jgi:TRIAD3 protein (E3 ubiquitin-protein ligase RNF216)
MPRPVARHDDDVVDLTSEDEDDELRDDDIENLDVESIGEHAGSELDFDHLLHDPYQNFEIGNRDYIDLTALPDIDVAPSEPASPNAGDAHLVDDVDETQLISETNCLRLVLDVFPDVSIDHVLTMIKARTTDQTRTKIHSEQIVVELLEGVYPKEADMISKKRRRADSEGFSDYEQVDHVTGIPNYDTDA